MTMPLMTQTLPTIVGMGVVSRTTETMFGNRKGSRRQKRFTNSNTVKVGNRVYKLHTGERGGRYYIRKSRKIYI